MKKQNKQYPLIMEKEKLEKLRLEAKQLDVSLNSYLKTKLLKEDIKS